MQPAFKRAYKTIVAADIVTGIAAVVLYLTAVSSVRGFALTLGVATLLDLFVVYFFKRPTVFLIARNPRLVYVRGFGLASGVAGEDHEPVVPPVRSPEAPSEPPARRRHLSRPHDPALPARSSAATGGSLISGVVIVLSLIGLIVRGSSNLSIDFEGGAQIAVHVHGRPSRSQEVSDILDENGHVATPRCRS